MVKERAEDKSMPPVDHGMGTVRETEGVRMGKEHEAPVALEK